MKTAFCFPGQGSQSVGMGTAFADTSPAAAAVFAEASAAYGADLLELCRNGPKELLDQTEITQPALTTASLACLAAVREAGISADVSIGHSAGEYAALVASGILEIGDAIRLTQARGVATAAAAAATPGAMAAVIGLEDADVEALCDSIDGVWVANYNCPGQVVVSGEDVAVDALIEAATKAGARRALKLAVSGAFHSPLTAAAADDLRPALDATTFHAPATNFISTVTCQSEDETAIVEILTAQLGAPVRFTQVVQSLASQGVTEFVEVGPGGVLAGLIRRIDRNCTVVTIGDPEGLAKAQEVLHHG
ncbi:MAG: [acyl-carrier-protein] S-malonyltransferase [Thermoleophilia bacterium]|nr:[acyl-carrier-protein] S-malonyltransferase [Thermoleophilia bacterium]